MNALLGIVLFLDSAIMSALLGIVLTSELCFHERTAWYSADFWTVLS